ncbi:MAG: tetratricopeptide repeat protein [Planctomycetaceae bacterium]
MRLPRFIRRWNSERKRGPAGPKRQWLKGLYFPFLRLWKWVSETRKKRSLKNLWWGIPAVILAVVAGTVLLMSSLNSDNRTQYRDIALRAYRNGDFDAARIFLERVYRSGDAGPKVQFLLATTLDAQGEPERANAMVDALSPEDGVGYPDAHFLKAKALMAANPFPPTYGPRAYHHLEASAGDRQKDAEWFFLRSRLALRWEKDREASLSYLKQAAALDQSLLLDLALAYEALGLQDARVTYTEAQKHFEKLLERDGGNDQARISLGVILCKKTDFSGALSVLRGGLAFGDKRRFGEALAAVMMAEYNELLKVPDSEVSRLRKINEALKFHPESKDAMHRLAFFGEEDGSSPESRQRSIDRLEGMIANGQQNAVAHLALGTKAWQANDKGKAEFHWRRAYEIDPSLAVGANNLAWVLASKGEPELDHALSVMNTLVKKHPNVPSFLSTRGRIHMKAGNWEAALQDLEFVLRSDPHAADVHESLSEVYVNLKVPQPSLASKHKKLAQQLRTQEEFGTLGK